MLAWVTAKIRALHEYPETAKRKGWPKDLSRVAFPFIDSKKLYQLLRSPRSNPMVSFCCEIFLLCAAALLLKLFIAGLLFICAPSTSITWERIASRRRPAFSSHLIATV
jgi:hypothetical protein